MAAQKILVIDNEERMCHLLQAALASESLQIETAFDGEEGWQKFQQDQYALVITDLKMPKLSGLALLEKIKETDYDTDVILMTAFATAQTAVNAMKNGAYDYLIKPFDMDELRLKVKRLLEKKRLEAENINLKQRLQSQYHFENIIGKSGKMQDVFKLVEKVVDADTTVLIRGESGTGKELIAIALHQNGSRAKEPFIAVNCAAIPENLLESELFGYEKGAFTGADRTKPGRFEIAGAGTIFLDEIGDLSSSLQVKLLRVLQTRQIDRLGGTETIPVKARVITATNRDLEAMLKEGKFREDLYYRINIFPVQLPPLRERIEDIPLLAEFFLHKFAGDKPVKISAEAEKILLRYNWPGNVRELENVSERAVLLCGEGSIETKHLPQHLQFHPSSVVSDELPDEGIQLEEHEKKLIRQALAKAGGNKSNAAQLLGITRRKLYSMMERLDIKDS
ncbi:MAG TPA: sigma-54-dependent Fis family transcriptional regulator [Bacteroidetes bacterium]|nr:sigma-54-dependent Fis family transcriptional regulator [Bacteroidota bacterium]